MGCDGYAALKACELVVCIICIILKRVADDQAIHVFYQLQKLSQEWPYLNNITWDDHGYAFADITYGGFVIITAGLLIGYVAGELKKGKVMEIFFLFLGFLFFAILGGLVLGSIEFVPPHLENWAAALGAFSLIGALLFLVDLLTVSKRQETTKKAVDNHSQTSVDTVIDIPVENKVTQTNGFIRNGVIDDKNHGVVVNELRSSLKGSKPQDMEAWKEVGGWNEKGTTPDLMKGQKGYYGGERGVANGIENPIFEKMGEKQTNYSYLEDQKYLDQSEIPVSHNLEKFKKRKSRRTYSSGESDFDDFIHLPTVSFLLAERGKKGVTTEGRGSTQMLPMLPVVRSEDESRRSRSSEDELRRSRSIENLLRKEDLERERRDLENQREQLAREREKYLFDSRKQKERDVTPELTDYYRTPALTPDFGATRKKSVTIKDAKDDDDVQDKLTAQGFRKVESEPTKRKNVNFTEEFSSDKKRLDAEYYTRPSKKVSIVDPDSGRASGTPTPDYERRDAAHFRFDARDANSSRASSEARSNPSTPLDPGFVMHAAHNWPENTSTKTPSQSPQYRTSSDEDPPTFTPARTGKATYAAEKDDDDSHGASLSTQLLQKWLKRRSNNVVRVAP